MKERDLVSVTFLDVGQGDSVVVILPDRRSAILVDSPPGPTTVEFLLDHEIEYLPLVVLSHMHWDHIGSILDVTAAFPAQIGLLALNFDYIPPAAEPQRRQFKAALRDLAAQMRRGLHGSPALCPWEAQYQGLRASILHPSHADVGWAIADGRPNNASVVLRMGVHGHYVLLPGDLQSGGWQSMRERGPDLFAEVLKFPHHGGAYADGNGEVPQGAGLSDMLAAVSPEVVVISVGTNNTHGHPLPDSIHCISSANHDTRVLCTQATLRCTPSPSGVRDAVMDVLPDTCCRGASAQSTRACPCAGTVIVELSEAGVVVIPSPEEHMKARSLFGSPMCARVVHLG